MPQRSPPVYEIRREGAVVSYLQLIHCAESAGAERLDIATLEYVDAVLEDFIPADLLNDEIEISRPATGEIIHWGKVTIVPPVVSANVGEVLRFTSRTELYLIGGKIDGYWVWDPTASPSATFRKVDGEVVFNPMIDGLIYGNLNDTQTATGDPLFLDPESVRTAAAQTLQGANVELWSLAGAVYYLLWSLNTAETYVANLNLAALNAIFNDPTALVQDVRLPRGIYLGQALDLLLQPLGYNWRIKRTALGARTFDFWKRGTGGTLVWVNHQRTGAALNLAQTNVETAAVTFDISQIANEITARGGFGEYEVTVELARGWDDADDPPAGVGDELAKDHANFDDVKDVLRKWVLNEAGDYIGLRTEIDGIFTDDFRTALASAGVTDRFVPRRRRLLPTLTLGPDLTPIGRIQGIEIEYSNTASPAWKPIVNWGARILDHEAGIYFDADKLPEEFLFDPANLRIRVTATIQSDFRLTGSAPRLAASPNEDVVPLVLDLPDRFRYRIRHSALSKYGGGVLPSLAVNDGAAILAFTEFVRNVWDMMFIAGVIQLEGTDHSYIVGSRVQGIQHKNISFEARTASGAYPHIVAIERDVMSQTMTLHLERQRDVIPLPQAPRGSSPRFRPRSMARRSI